MGLWRTVVAPARECERLRRRRAEAARQRREGTALHRWSVECVPARLARQADADPLGCLGDVGWYNLRTIMFANGWELPTYVSAHALDVNDEGVPLTMAGVVGYESSISTFDIGFDAPRAQLAEIVGKKATISWDGFIGPDDPTTCSFTVSVTGDPFRGEESSVVTTDVALPMTQAASTVEHLSLAILGGEPDPFWAEIMLKTQRVVDAVQKSWQEDGRKVLVEPLAAKM